MAALLRRAATTSRSDSRSRALAGFPAAIGLRYCSTTVLPQTRRSSLTGLYGFDHLKTAKGFQRFVDDAIERAGELINFISGMPESQEIIQAMDGISDAVCSVVDSAELCRQTHPDPTFVEEATKASMRINEYLHYLNTHHTLYKAVLKAEQDSHLLTPEAQRAAHTLRIDFEKGGIHLPEEKLKCINQLNIDIAHLCRDFNQNIITDPGYVDIFPASRIPKNLHCQLKPIYRPTSCAFLQSKDNMKDMGFRISTEQCMLASVLQRVSDDEVRKLAYVRGNSSPHANLSILDKLISARHELAQMMGYKSYAEFVVHQNMATSPEVVRSFLLDICKISRPKADEEFRALRDFKRGKTGQANVDLESWDEKYFSGLMKSSFWNFDSSAVASFFPLSQCIVGLKVLVESLFGATFQCIPVAPGESWHPDVLKFSLHHPDEGDLGYLYLDLYSRKGKYPGCAHFSIKGGRRISELEYQLPVVALVCNFSSSKSSPGARLDHWEVEALFHEFGHALHSLLSRTSYQHFSGTRVALDLAETPSNLFEHYVWDYRVLKTFARHYETGETIPKGMFESMQGAKMMFGAMEMQQQILYALVDQTLFGEQPLTAKGTASVVAELKRQYTSWKHVDGTYWHSRFYHLLNYGAGYYTYLYAKCFAATIWREVCREDPLSAATGDELRTKLLKHGGAKEPASLLTDLAGDKILRHHNGGIVPTTTSLCEEMKLF